MNLEQKTKININEIIAATENYEDANDGIFLEALNSKNESIIWWGAKGSGLKKIKKAIPKLVELLGKPAISLGTTDVRKISALALSQMGFENFSMYLEHVNKNPNPLLREGLADVIGLTKESQGLPFLDKLMNDENNDVLLWTTLSLSKLGEISIPVIKKHLLSTNDFKKAFYLLDSLRKIGTNEAKRIIEDYLQKTDFEELKTNKQHFLKDNE